MESGGVVEPGGCCGEEGILAPARRSTKRLNTGLVTAWHTNNVAECSGSTSDMAAVASGVWSEELMITESQEVTIRGTHPTWVHTTDL